jgi:hypothetical protein
VPANICSPIQLPIRTGARFRQAHAPDSALFSPIRRRKALLARSSRVPGEQSISRAEAFAVLGALLLIKSNIHLTIYCDRLFLVNQINRLLNTTAFHSPSHRLSDRSLILRILHEIRTRPAPTFLYHVKAHTRDHCPLPPNFASLRGVALHQEFNRLADRAAKSSLTASRFVIADELTFRPPALFRLA